MRYSDELIQETRSVVEQKYGKRVSDTDAEKMLSNLTGFFALLQKLNLDIEKENKNSKERS